jgi:hypothetical protein
MAGSAGKGKKTKKSSKKAPAARSKPKPKPKAKPSRTSAKATPPGLEGFVVVDSTKRKKSAPAPGVNVIPTPPLEKIKQKHGFRGYDANADTQNPPTPVQHGRIVRVRPTATDRDPADEIGDKAVYLDPAGNVEFRQG